MTDRNMSKRDFLGLGVKAGVGAVIALSPVAALAEACDPSTEVFPTDERTRESAIYKMAVDIENLDPASSEFERISNTDLDTIETQVKGYIESNLSLANEYLEAIQGYSAGNHNLRSLAAGNPITGTSPDLYNPSRERRNIGAYGEQLQTLASNIMAGQDVDFGAAGEALTATRDRLIEATTAKFEAVRELRRDPTYAGCEGIETPVVE